jgi:hypothetical protein
MRRTLCRWFARWARSHDSALDEVGTQLLDLVVGRGDEGQPHGAVLEDPCSCRAALLVMAPCVRVINALTAGIRPSWIARAAGRSPASTAVTMAR